MLIASDIIRALEQLPDLREYDRFQEMAFHIARTTWTGLRLTRKVHDRSADAINNTENLALACGWAGDLFKLRDDCRGLKANRPNVKKVVFATSRVVEEPQVLKWKEAVKAEFSLELVEVLHRDAIVGELTRPASRWIAHQYLRLPIGDFADMETYLPRIKDAAKRIISAWRADYLAHENAVLDLRIAATGEDSSDDWPHELRLDSLGKGIRRGDFIWILGQPGSGKTQFLLALAEGLVSADTVIPVLIQIRNWGMQGGRLLDHVAAEPAMQLQGITAQTLATALEAGHIALLLNGWNEVSDEQKSRIAADVQSVVSQFQGSTLICTGRSTPSLKAPRARTDLRIQELADNEIRAGFAAAQVPNTANAVREVIGNPRIVECHRSLQTDPLRVTSN